MKKQIKNVIININVAIFAMYISFLCKCKEKGLAMALQKEKMQLVTALGTVTYGEEVLVSIPESKRRYNIYYSRNGVETKEIQLEEMISFTPFGVRKDVRGNIFAYYIAGLGKKNTVSFIGEIGVKYAQKVLNDICSDVFSKDGVTARSLRINDIKSQIKNERIRGINLPGNYWLSTVFFQDLGLKNRAYGIYSLDNGFLNKVYMFDEKRRMVPEVQKKEIVALLKVKVDMDKTKKLWASC